MSNIYEPHRETNLKNAEHYGFEVQSNQCVEECAELIQALNKFKRSFGAGKPPRISREEALDNIIEEIADVEIMLEQMIHLIGIHRRDIDAIKVDKVIHTFSEIAKESCGAF